MWFAGLVLAVGGLVTVVVIERARSGRLGPNHVAGIRLPSTMRSDEAWRAAHVAGWPATLVGGAGGVVFGLAGMVADLVGADEGLSSGLVLAGGAVLLVGVLVGARAGVRAARRVDAGPIS